MLIKIKKTRALICLVYFFLLATWLMVRELTCIHMRACTHAHLYTRLLAHSHTCTHGRAPASPGYEAVVCKGDDRASGGVAASGVGCLLYAQCAFEAGAVVCSVCVRGLVGRVAYVCLCVSLVCAKCVRLETNNNTPKKKQIKTQSK